MWTCIFELVPSGNYTCLLQKRIIKHRMRIIESPIGNANQYVLAIEALRQSRTEINTVGTYIVAHAIEMRGDLGWNFHV